MERLLHEFVVLFVVVDPVGIAPIFMGLAAGLPEAERRRTALRAVVLSAALMLAFAFAGEPLLTALGIGLPAFRIAGGLLLFLLALDMVFVRHTGLRTTTPSEREEALRREDLSVFPLAFPLIAGPGALTTVILLAAGREGAAAWAQLAGVILAVVAATAAALWLAAHITRLLGQTGANMVTRVLGLVVAALAVQYVLDGLRGALGGLSPP
ncbi:MAG TPA: NAAT family transporter [Chromatiales bacterium]|nr:NAAT family transporter [Chromatiales bacterium]